MHGPCVLSDPTYASAGTRPSIRQSQVLDVARSSPATADDATAAFAYTRLCHRLASRAPATQQDTGPESTPRTCSLIARRGD